MSNLDDIFRFLREKHIKEIDVTDDLMFMIAQWSIANATGAREQELSRNQVMEVIRSGTMDKFFGVKLNLI